MGESDGSAGSETRRIFAWCLPRTCSTTLMYSFGARSDAHVVDEPHYASYLWRNPGVYRSYREAVLDAQERDGAKVTAALASGPVPGGKRVLFAKLMSKHAAGLDLEELLKTGVHVVLYRDPVKVLASYAEARTAKVVGPVTLDETGYPSLVSIASRLRELGRPAVCIDGDELARDPERVLRLVCQEADVEFEEEMLSWEAGPKSFEGVWADEWYRAVRASTGWISNPRDRGEKWSRAFPADLVDLLRDATPFYEVLAKRDCTRSKTHPLRWPSPLFPRCHSLDDPTARALLPDEKNRNVLVWVGAPGRGRLVPRDLARVSVLDSAVQGGDACWEGLRVYRNRVFALDLHLKRLADSAKSLCFENCHTEAEIKHAIFATLLANGMTDDAHVRLTLTRGEKVSSSMNPKFNVFGATLIVLAEFKPVVSTATYDNEAGVKLISSSIRRNSPQVLDSKIHHNNLLNNILAKIQANAAGAADALMLDLDGYVSETNATNVFAVRNGVLLTPHADHCLPGVTRGLVIDLCADLGLECRVKRLSLVDFYTADEVFTTGTMGELTPCVSIDARVIGHGKPGPVLARIRDAFRRLTLRDSMSVPISSEDSSSSLGGGGAAPSLS